MGSSDGFIRRVIELPSASVTFTVKPFEKSVGSTTQRTSTASDGEVPAAMSPSTRTQVHSW